ncbi:hypothetical protein LTR17_016427 [Elasticomyces elasticus]|nr:hypothetical protein LTR17_016427 [Elasticomyces elasticus]
MPTYDYKYAKGALTETEKDRILCIYLNGDMTALNSSIDWEKATAAYGSASVESMRKSLTNSLKKIADKTFEEGAEPSPEKPKSGGGRKRKANADGGEEEKTPKKRGGGKKKKDASESPVKGDGEEDSAMTGGVKAEAEEDDA